MGGTALCVCGEVVCTGICADGRVTRYGHCTSAGGRLGGWRCNAVALHAQHCFRAGVGALEGPGHREVVIGGLKDDEGDRAGI